MIYKKIRVCWSPLFQMWLTFSQDGKHFWGCTLTEVYQNWLDYVGPAYDPRNFPS